jgi:AcrR family transcriptional regulator
VAVSTAPTPERPRRYDSTRRRQLAGETRLAVIRAAAELFVEQGWAGTSMRDVAKAAGVSVETVYASVGPKTELLKVAIDVGVAGDDEPIPLSDRPEFRALAVGDLHARARAAGVLVTHLHLRTAGLHRVLQHAAASEPALAELLRHNLIDEREQVRQGMSAVVGHPITQAAADEMFAVLSNDVYLLLTEVRGWSLEHYQTWVGETILRLLAPLGSEERDEH